MKKKCISLVVLLAFIIACSTPTKKTVVPLDSDYKPATNSIAQTSTPFDDNAPIKSDIILPNGVSTRETKRGTILVFNPKITFKYAESKIPESDYKVFPLVKYVIDNNPNVNIILEGHTGNIGIAYPYNYQLSVDRVQAGKKYMVSMGISTNRFSVMPLGEALPEFSNQDSLRRYEFVIIRNEQDKKKYDDFIKNVDVKKETDGTVVN